MGIISNIFGRKEKMAMPVDLSVLKCDIHSHLIPGIDDGSKNMEDSIGMLKKFADLGYRKVITSPHVMSDYYRNSSSTILEGRDKVREELRKREIPIAFDAVAEYYLDEHFEELIKKKDLLTFGDNYVLFELSFLNEPMMAKRVIFELQMAGYKAVLAHPERYEYYTSVEELESYVDRGVYLQMNTTSIAGFYSPTSKKMAQKLIEKNLISFIGSDCHHMGHLQCIANESRYYIDVKTLIDSGELMNDQL